MEKKEKVQKKESSLKFEGNLQIETENNADHRLQKPNRRPFGSNRTD